MNFNLIKVGVADFKIASSPDIIRTILGSCVGICLYDPKICIGGLSHIMLPLANGSKINKKKYADTAIPLLLEEMERNRAIRKRIVAKIVGGSSMFKMSKDCMMAKIGDRNVEAAKQLLQDLNIHILSEDVGGDYGRTIDFFVENGMIKIKSLNRPVKMI